MGRRAEGFLRVKMTAGEPRAGTTNVRRAALFMVLATGLFSLMGASVKHAAAGVPDTMVVFFRNAVMLAWLVPWAARHGPSALRTRHLGEHAVRGLMGLAAMYCFFFALARLRLADAMLLNQSFPLFVPLIERAWLRERIPRGTWRALTVGFLGVVLILRPGSAVFTAAALVGLCSAVFAAVAQVGIRRLTHTEPTTRIVFYFGLIATTVSSAPLPWSWRAADAATWVALVATGGFATAGQFALTRAYANAPAARVGPFVYVGVVFAGLLDWLVWKTPPDWVFAAGAGLVVTAAALTLRRSARPKPTTAGQMGT